MRKLSSVNSSRRKFLCAAPAAAGLALADLSLFPAPATAQNENAAAFQLFRAQELQADLKALEAAPGNKKLVNGKNYIAALTVEKAKSAKEFEWHESVDHIFQILDGATVYELGGKPQNPRQTKPGEWLAPASEGATSLALNKGDIITIPRGTPHRRSTAGSVTFLLISPQGTAGA
jgi:quercetin dioxygenase-like cupin family protein